MFASTATRENKSFTMEIQRILLCAFVIASIVFTSVNASPRGQVRGTDNEKQVKLRQPRELRGQRVKGYGGAGGEFSSKTFQRRDPLVLPPSDLPKSLSDHTASEYGGLFYIAGGCDSPDGRQLTTSPGTFACSSVSDSFYSFGPAKFLSQYEVLPDMPSARYRHSSAAVNGYIWLVGGRDLNDTLVDTVDVYDVAMSHWSSFALPSEYQVSDHATFSKDGYIYIAGGYDSSNNEVSSVYRINAGASVDTLIIESVAPLSVARGDTVALRSDGFAYVVGGSNNQGCDGSRVVERYDFVSGQWEVSPELNFARGNFGMVEINDLIIVLGGERLVDNFCSSPLPDPASSVLSVETAETFGRGRWFDLGNVAAAAHRYRPVVVAWPPTQGIYVIGGLATYDETCQCYPATNSVTIDTATYGLAVDATTTPSPTPAPSPVPTEDPGVEFTTGNDLCEDAAEIAVTVVGTQDFIFAFGNTESATWDNVGTCGNENVSNDQPGVWFKAVGIEGLMTALTCFDFTDYDTKLSVFTGPCNNLVCINADDDGCPGTRASRVSWNALDGTIYYILVHGWITNPVGNFALRVQVRDPPNDRCYKAIGPLAVGDSVEGTTLYASLNFGGSGQALGQTCGGSYGNVEGIWYYTIGTGNTMIADTCDPRTGYDTKLHVFTGDCQQEGDSEDLDCVAGNDNNDECVPPGGSPPSFKSKVSWNSVVGETYYIYVHGFQAAPSRGFFVLRISEE